MREQLISLTNRTSLPNEVEPLKDIIVSLSQQFLKFWDEHEKLKIEVQGLKQRIYILEEENIILKAENAALKIEILELKAENTNLKAENQLLKYKLYGRKSEQAQKKTSQNPSNNNDNKSKKSRNHPGRQTLPSNLPRERMEHDLKPQDKICPKCNSFLSQIGEETSEQLDLIRTRLRVIEHTRLKYACKCCNKTVKIAETPYKPIDKGLASAGLMAHIIVGKYTDHLPLYRQACILKRYGITINRSTLCSWIKASSLSLKSLYELMQEDLLSSDHIYSDDTSMPTLRIFKVDNSKPNKAHKARMWFYGQDGNNGKKPIIIYDYTLGRGSEHIENFLQGFKGHLQADAYSGYDFVFKVDKNGIKVCIEVACLAHLRRKFVDVLITNPDSIAKEIVELIARLYALEAECKRLKLSIQDIYRQRQLQSKPVLAQIKLWLDKHVTEVTPASQLGKAINYGLNHWDAFCEFCNYGKLAIDNNFSERNMKTIVIGRKNYLFAGSQKGGESAAILYSLLETCKQNGVDPEAYLADVLLKVQYHPNSRARELLPYNWKPPGQNLQNQAA